MKTFIDGVATARHGTGNRRKFYAAADVDVLGHEVDLVEKLLGGGFADFLNDVGYTVAVYHDHVQVDDGFFLTSFDSNAGCTGGSGGPDSVGHGAEYSAGGCPTGPCRIRRGRRGHGCILADSVGLGKTYAALAVVRYFEQRNERVLVLCPRKLRDNWSLYQASNGHIQNPFPDDRFAYTLLSHTDLSRDTGMSGSVDLANLNWRNYDLVVIDESHNFRNDHG